jgi:hypothetical protein
MAKNQKKTKKNVHPSAKTQSFEMIFTLLNAL